MEVRNAIIESAEIIIDAHGCLSAWLRVSYGGMGQWFGGYPLYLPESFTDHKIESIAGHFIFKCMEIAGVTKWSDLVGKSIRVKCGHDKVHAVGHVTDAKWFPLTMILEEHRPQSAPVRGIANEKKLIQLGRP